jgi:hypothetical protein
MKIIWGGGDEKGQDQRPNNTKEQKMEVKLRQEARRRTYEEKVSK